MVNVYADKRRGKPKVYTCLQGGMEGSRNRDFLSTQNMKDPLVETMLSTRDYFKPDFSQNPILGSNPIPNENYSILSVPNLTVKRPSFFVYMGVFQHPYDSINCKTYMFQAR